MLNSILDKFASLGVVTLTKWSVLFVTFVILLALLRIENKKTRYQSYVSASYITHSISNLAIKRSWYIVAFFIIYILTVVSYDIKIRRSEIAEEHRKQTITQNVTPTSVIHKSPIAPDKILSPDSKETAVVGLFEHITTFSETNAANESLIDELKKNYEQILVTYYILEKCNKSSLDNFQTIQDIILLDLKKHHGSPDTLTKIIDASKGLYDEMYSRTDCQEPMISNTKQQLDANLQRLQTRLNSAY
jgi:hypothetical protein